MSTSEPTTESELRLGQADDGRPTTTEEFAEAEYDEPWTYERVDGRLVVLPPHGTDHVISSEPWRNRLAVHSMKSSKSEMQAISYSWIHIDERNSRIADIGIYLGTPLEGLRIPDQIPELVFEFVSPRENNARRNYVEKRVHYQRVGVREYVIVDRFDKTVTVLRLVEGSYVEQLLTLADTYRTPLLPGFEVPLAEVLSR